MRIVLEATEEEMASEGYLTAAKVAVEMDKCLQLLLEKERAYRGAWRDQGWMGQTGRLLSKASRLKALAWQPFETDLTSESLIDTVQDTANLCFLWLLNKEAKNRWGR